MNARRMPGFRAALLLAIVPAVWALTIPFEASSVRDVDQQEVCLGCHDLSEALESKVPHAPAAMGECTACHNPHVSRFEALLLEHPARLCVACHDDLGDAMGQTVVHEPVEAGRCADCHSPHGAEHTGLLDKPVKELCRECHEGLTEWEAQPVQHAPFTGGECSDCHDPHASDHPGLAAEAGGELCAGCHSFDDAFRGVHGGYPVEQADCRQCHDPHASARAGLFRSNLHAPFEGGDCSGCHAEATASEPFSLVARQGELCGECHEGQVETARTASYPHVSAGGGRCTECHNPHSGDGQSLLNGKIQSVCLTCHDPGGSRSGEEGRFVTHEDQDCSACHAPHGAEEPFLLQTNSVDVCKQCHEHEHGIRHPLGEGTRDPRSGNPMSCLSCHGIHNSPYEMYLHGSQERDLCLGCHKDIGSGR